MAYGVLVKIWDLRVRGILGETVVDFVAGGPKGISSGWWELDNLEGGVVGWDWLKGDVRVPSGRVVALSVGAGSILSGLPLGVNFSVLLRADDGNLVVVSSKLSLGIGNWVDVELAGLWLSGKGTKTLDKSLEFLAGELVLTSKENNTALGNSDGKVAEEGVRVLGIDEIGDLDVSELTTNHGGDIVVFEVVKSTRELEWWPRVGSRSRSRSGLGAGIQDRLLANGSNFLADWESIDGWGHFEDRDSVCGRCLLMLRYEWKCWLA